MADTVKFELVSPERLLFSADVESVVVPGTEGDFGVLPGHARLISTVRPGVISVFQNGKVTDRIFVEGGFADAAYADQALPIACGQTISQPYVVAYMTEQLQVRSNHRVLEIGTGSGYQAAVLSRVVGKVFTIEYVPALARSAAKVLAGYPNIVVREGDGYGGWPEHGPYDIILVTAAPETLPPALVDQLAPGGRLIIPIGSTAATQELKLIQKRADGTVTTESIAPVRFVPLVGGK